MKAHLAYLLLTIRESFWLLPSLMVVASIVTSRVALLFDHARSMEIIADLFWFGAPDIASSRLILSTVAGAMITTASLVFSLTLVALTLASQQLGPRLLSMFLRDRMTQVVLGLFLSTFVFALIVLMALGGVDRPGSVPIFAMTIAIFATIASFVALIVFIHHLATSLQADVVVSRVALNLLAQFESYFSRLDSQPEKNATSSNAARGEGREIETNDAGYIQAIDHTGLFDIAVEHDLCIEILRRPGHFMSRGETLAVVHPASADPEKYRAALCQMIVFGSKRTSTQDPEFALMAIVEIALRALSPGINDPHTANTCIDRLSEALSSVFHRQTRREANCDEQGIPRVIEDAISIDGLVDAAFNQIRQHSAGHVDVTIRLAEALQRLAYHARTSEHTSVIHRHANMLERAVKRNIEEPEDLDEIKVVLEKIREALDRDSDKRATSQQAAR